MSSNCLLKSLGLVDLGGAPPLLPGGPLPPPPVSWADIAQGAKVERSFKLSFVPPSNVDGEVMVVPSEAAMKVADAKWSECLVGYLVGAKIPFKPMQVLAKRLWATEGLSDIVQAKDFFFFRFPDASARKKVLEGGPWLFAGKPMVLQQWTPTMPMTKQTFSSLPLWVHFWNVPVSLWSAQGLGEVASAVGRPLYADSQTELGHMVNFARICVEVDATRPLITSFYLSFPDGKHCIEVDYQWKPLVCVQCGVFGHGCTKRQASGQGDHPIPSGAEVGDVPGSKDGESAGGSDTLKQKAVESNASTPSTQGYCPYGLLMAESILDPPKKNRFDPLVEDEDVVEVIPVVEKAKNASDPEVQEKNTDVGTTTVEEVLEAGERRVDEGLGSLLDKDIPSTADVEKLVQENRSANASVEEQSNGAAGSGIDLASNSNAEQTFADSSVLFTSVPTQTLDPADEVLEEEEDEDNVVFETPHALLDKREIVVALSATQKSSQEKMKTSAPKGKKGGSQNQGRRAGSSRRK